MMLKEEAVSETEFVHKMPESYVAQDGCWNCYWCFIKGNWDCGNDYYCRRKAPKRPKCGSGAMGESFSPGRRWPGRKAYRRAYDKGSRLWDEWANGRQVAPWGKCEKHGRQDRPRETAAHLYDNVPRQPRRPRKKETKGA